MAKPVGLEHSAFVPRYWEHPPDYDRGGSAEAVWAKMVDGAPLQQEALAPVVRIDAAVAQPAAVLTAQELRVALAAAAEGAVVDRLGAPVGAVSPSLMSELDAALRLHLAL